MAGVSKSEIKREVVERLEAALDQLYSIWHDIGIIEPQMRERAGTVSLHLCNLLEEMVKEEEEMKRQIMRNIETFKLQVESLCRELAITPHKQTEGLSMLLREKELRGQQESLTREKSDRLRQLKLLKERDLHLCEVLCSTPYYIPTGTTPSLQQLSELEAHVATLTTEKEQRYTEFVQKKKDIISLFNEMNRSPDTSFERDIMCEEDESFLLSKENMKSLGCLLAELESQKRELKKITEELWDKIKELWDRLELPQEECKEFQTGKEEIKPSLLPLLRAEVYRCEQLKTQYIQRFVEGARRDLAQWWDKCFYSQAQREAFKHFKQETFTEELLKLHELELEKVKEYYKRNETLLEQVAKRQSLFNQMLVLEKKASDPNRYNNRGGGLLQEEKVRKRIMKELPKVEDDVKALIAKWEAEHDQEFLVDGVRFSKFLELQWANYYDDKVREKEQRHQARTKQMEEEMIYGSKPTTPAKRRFNGTPVKTPNKSRRIDNMGPAPFKFNDTKTPNSASRTQNKNSTFMSPVRRPPLSSSRLTSAKTAQGRMQRRRSLRQARKALGDYNQQNIPNQATTDLFSHTTVSSGESGHDNASLASMGSYQDFAVPPSRASSPKEAEH